MPVLDWLELRVLELKFVFRTWHEDLNMISDKDNALCFCKYVERLFSDLGQDYDPQDHCHQFVDISLWAYIMVMYIHQY